jgi:hypothetical protein
MHLTHETKLYFNRIVDGCSLHIKDLIGSNHSCFFVTHSTNSMGCQSIRTKVPNQVFNNLKPSNILRDFEQFYRHVCSYLIGNNWHRPSRRSQQPIAYVFLDVPGTRYGKPTISRNVTPDIHSLWCVCNQLAQRFREFFDEYAQVDALSAMRAHRNIDIQEVTHKPNDVVSYCAKLLRWEVPYVADDTFWAVFPRSLSETRSSNVAI